MTTKNENIVKELRRRERKAEKAKIKKARQHAEEIRLKPYSDRKLRHETVWLTVFTIACFLGVLLFAALFFEIIILESTLTLSVRIVLFALGAMAGVLMLLAYAGILTVHDLYREQKRRNE